MDAWFGGVLRPLVRGANGEGCGPALRDGTDGTTSHRLVVWA